MPPITVTPLPGQMTAHLTDVPAFPGEGFGLGFPEAIGDATRAHWPPGIALQWRRLDESWEQTGRAEGELSYRLAITPHTDYVDVRQTLTNESGRPWAHTLAFNCFQCGGAPSTRDHDCLRHWVGMAGKPVRLAEVPRAYGPRPTIQLYSVEGAPAGRDLPFVAGFRETPADVTLEPWMAIVSRDGQRLVAAASQPALFLFQNMEYSCIHAAAGFGPLEPGQSGEALTRLYFVAATLEAWYERMRQELGARG